MSLFNKYVEEEVQTTISTLDFVLQNDLLLESILQNLNCRGLQKITTVCKEWDSLAKRIQKKRKVIHHLFYIYQVSGHQRRKSLNLEECFQPNNIYAGSDYQSMASYITNQTKERTWSKPSFALLFHGNFCPHSQKVNQLLDFNLFRKYLPPTCHVLSISSSVGLIGSPCAPVSPIDVQAEFIPLAGLSYLYLPKFTFDIRVFDETESLAEYYPNSQGNHKKLKCILMFATSSVDEAEVYRSFEEIDKVYNLYEKNLALGGVVIDDIRFTEHNEERKDLISKEMVGIAISGDCVKAASAVIDLEEPEVMERVLKEFKGSLDFDPDVHDSSQETLGFVFICSGRGIHIFGKSNAEVGLIRKIFPKIKLTGVFGHGEYGENFWPKMVGAKLAAKGLFKTDEEYDSPVLELPEESVDTRFWHFYTTIFVLVNFSKK